VTRVLDAAVLGRSSSAPQTSIAGSAASRIVPWRPALAFTACLAALLLLASVSQDLLSITGRHVNEALRLSVLDVDVEQSFYTWLSVVLLFSASLVLFVIGYERRGRPLAVRLVWLGLSGLFLLLSADESVGLHERVSSILHLATGSHGLLYFAWAAPAGLLTLLGLSALVPFLRTLPQRIAMLMLLSAAAYIGGAVVLEMLGGAVAEAQGRLATTYRALANAEEGLEMAGILIFLYTLFLFRELPAADVALRRRG
jgi:hypothetical protein